MIAMNPFNPDGDAEPHAHADALLRVPDSRTCA
jgi:hypothetical protein